MSAMDETTGTDPEAPPIPTPGTPVKGMCPYCGEKISGQGGKMKHLKEAHPDKLVEYMAEMRQKKSSSPAKDSGAVPENTPKTKTTATTTKTTDYRQANVFAFVPKKFEFSSTLLPLAKQVSMEVWGWPDYEMSDFVDTFIYACLRAAGIKVAHYQVENPEELAEEAEPQGNGHGDIDELKAGLAQLNGKFDVLLSAIVKAGGK